MEDDLGAGVRSVGVANESRKNRSILEMAILERTNNGKREVDVTSGFSADGNEVIYKIVFYRQLGIFRIWKIPADAKTPWVPMFAAGKPNQTVTVKNQQVNDISEAQLQNFLDIVTSPEIDRNASPKGASDMQARVGCTVGALGYSAVDL